MRPFTRLALFAAVSTLLLAGTTPTLAQAGGNRGNRGGRDPAQFQARMMERYRDQLEVKTDDEWKIIQERIEKVMQAQRELRIGGFGFGRRGGNPGGGQADRPSPGGGRGPGGDRVNPESNPDVAALQQAVDAKAPAAELKAKLARVREVLKQKEANLAKAQEDLRSVLSLRQEAILVLSGLLR